MNYLKAVFWDLPQLAKREYLQKFILENRNLERTYQWLLSRFLEYGRVVDTLEYFSLQEISSQIPKLKLTPYTKQKWERILEVYGKPERK
jgi:hypothetical protein